LAVVFGQNSDICSDAADMNRSPPTRNRRIDGWAYCANRSR
jgi:hypothetical protein